MKTKQEILATNRARSYNWRADKQYQMSELNPDPRMRPSVDALIHKLRNMSMVKGKPEVASFIIHDLMYQELYRTTPHPQALWEIMVRANNLWQMALGISGRLEVDQASLEHAGQEVPEAIAHQMGLRIQNNLNVWHCHCGSDFHSQADYDNHRAQVAAWRSINTDQTDSQEIKKSPTTSGGASGATERSSGSGQDPIADDGASAVDSSANVEREEPSEQGFLPFPQALASKLKKERRELSKLIWNHSPRPKGLFITCDCGREFGDYDAWANHARIRVERYLLDQFAPDSQD